MNNPYKKKKSSSQVVVVSMMCTVLVSIVGQSINIAINPTQQDSVQAASYQRMHESATEETSGFITSNLNSRVDRQKDQVNDRLQKISGGKKDLSTSSKQLKIVETGDGKQGYEYHREDPHTHTEPDIEQPILGAYVPFYMLQNNLKEKSCQYRLPIDADPPLAPMIQWALDHCIITVSSSYKVNPYDYLTHKTMRIMAQRAGFVVKMEYASNDIVTNSQLLSFLNALQQHHQISDMPSILLGERVTRGEYIKLLYLLYTTQVDDADAKVLQDKAAKSTEQTTVTFQDIKSELSKVKINSSKTQQEENKENLLPLARSLSEQTLEVGKTLLGEYTDDTINNNPKELKNQLLNFVSQSLTESSHPSQEINSSIGVNTDAIQATRVQVQQWLGRSNI